MLINIHLNTQFPGSDFEAVFAASPRVLAIFGLFYY